MAGLADWNCHAAAMRFAVPCLSLVLWLPLVLCCTACTARNDPTTSAEERILLDQIQRDPYVVVQRMRRNDDQFLELHTLQGGVEVGYVLAPAIDGGRELTIRRIDNDLLLPAKTGPWPGTGPGPRGLHRTFRYHRL